MPATGPDTSTGVPPSEAPPPWPWLALLQGLVQELPGLVSDRIELFSLELHRAGLALGRIVALVVAAAILAATAWLALWGCIVGALVLLGLPWAAAVLIVLFINLALCWAAVARVRVLAPLLKLPATRRHLTLGASRTPTQPRPDLEPAPNGRSTPGAHPMKGS